MGSEEGGASTWGRPAAIRERLDEELLGSLFLWAPDSFAGNGVRGRLLPRVMGEPDAGRLTIPVDPWENLVRKVRKVRVTEGWVRMPPARAIAGGGEGAAC